MKLAKLSLAAIMAVGALSTANATNLEDAIKGVDLSGYAHYRLHDSDGEAWSEIELRAQLTAPVQEDIQFVTRFTADYTTQMDDSSENAANTSGSADPLVDRLLFNYTGFANTTVTLGRMYAGTPLDDTAALGLKVVSSPVKGLTLAGAYFHDNSKVSNALTAVAAMYSNDMFNARVWYIDMADEQSADKEGYDVNDGGTWETKAGSLVKGASFIFVEGGVNVGPAAIKAQYAQKDSDDAAVKTASTIRVQASASMDAFGARVGYISNDKDGGAVTIDNSLEGDNDLIYGGIYGLVQNNGADESAYFGEVSGTFGKFAAKAGYVSYDDFTYDDQYYGQVSYQMTKKFSTYVRYGSASPVAANTDDTTLARFHAQYNF